MEVLIQPIADHERYEVNGKEIVKDGSGNYVAQQELSQQERIAFGNYKKAVIENKNFKKHPKATFRH